MQIVYYSGRTGNTQAVVRQLGSLDLLRITDEDIPLLTRPYILFSPTYADGQGRGAIPGPVLSLLRREENARCLRGVVTTGNKFFGKTYGLAGKMIAAKFHVPNLHTVELRGMPSDIRIIKEKMESLPQ